jgi:hypothetical protein
MINKKFIFISFLLILTLFCLNNKLYSKDNPQVKINYQIFDSLAENFSKNIFEETISGKYDSINFHINDIPQNILITRNFTGICLDNNLGIFQSESKLLTHKIDVIRFELNYLLYDNSADSLIREINLEALITGENSKFGSFKQFKYIYSDTISRIDIPLIQSSSLPYTVSAIPERNKTFYEKALEPFILVSSAILTVLILFSVRTN